MYRPCLAPTFKPSTAAECIVRALTGVLLLALLAIAWVFTLGSPAILCQIRQLQFRIRHCRQGNTDRTIDVGFTLGGWLAATPSIRDAIVWRDQAGERSYSSWTREEKSELAAAYGRLVDRGDAGLPETYEVEFAYFGGFEALPERERPLVAVTLSRDDAWRMFLAYVAQSLAAEIRRLIPWSVLDASDEERRHLFHSDWLFLPVAGGRFAIEGSEGSFVHGRVTPGDPGRTFGFLVREGILAADRRLTIERLADWCREWLVHQTAGTLDTPEVLSRTNTRESNDVHWQYEGWAPVERMLAGTERRRELSGVRHWTAGCWGTTSFLRSVLRTANVAVALERRCTHAMPHFLREAVFVSHGDDFYNGRSRWEPRFPAGAFLQPIERMERWYGPGGNCAWVGRGVYEALAQHPPYELLRRHCDDVANGRDHAASTVYALFAAEEIPLAELEGGGLWTRIEEAIRALGGCDRVPMA